MNDIEGSNTGGVLLTTEEEEIGSKFKVTNGTFTNFFQHFEKESSTFIYSKRNIEITFNE